MNRKRFTKVFSNTKKKPDAKKKYKTTISKHRLYNQLAFSLPLIINTQISSILNTLLNIIG